MVKVKSLPVVLHGRLCGLLYGHPDHVVGGSHSDPAPLHGLLSACSAGRQLPGTASTGPSRAHHYHYTAACGGTNIKIVILDFTFMDCMPTFAIRFLTAML